jgi:hypothetical protein
MFNFHPKSAASLFLASLTLLVASTPLPAGAADTDVELRQLTHKNFNASIADDTWYVFFYGGLEWREWWDTYFPAYACTYHVRHHTSYQDAVIPYWHVARTLTHRRDSYSQVRRILQPMVRTL